MIGVLTPPSVASRRQGLRLLAICFSLFLAGCSSAGKQPVAEVVWQLPISDELIDEVQRHHGTAAANRVRFWRELIEAAGRYSELENVARVNEFFNGARFADDVEAWGVVDYWATPLEFLIRDVGDCEEFATAKYLTLKWMGIGPDRLRLTYCTATTLSQAHMVVSYYPDPRGEPLILDNIDGRILLSSERGDLIPVFSFNGNDLWLNRTRDDAVRAGSPDALNRWQDWRRRVDRFQVPAP